MKFLLDTNVFWKVLENWNNSTVSDLDNYIKKNGQFNFCLSEISNMEIHSVLGKNIRGKVEQQVKCERKILKGGNWEQCGYTWISPQQNGFNKRTSKAYIRLIDDILNNRNTDFEIEILPIGTSTISLGGFLLQKYAYKQDLRSLDATIAASAIEKGNLEDLTVITFDKKLKNILALEGLRLI